MISKRRLHRLTGTLLLTPLMTWAITGLVFFIQPGYGKAYAPLAVRQYPVESEVRVMPAADWLEYRVLRSILGLHVLAKTENGWTNLQADTLQAFTLDESQRRALVSDAISVDSDRYGLLSGRRGEQFITSNGVEITLDDNTLSLRQYGADTRWIDRLYKVHYLQWTGIGLLDKMLGVLGLGLLMVMSATGLRLLLRG